MMSDFLTVECSVASAATLRCTLGYIMLMIVQGDEKKLALRGLQLALDPVAERAPWPSVGT